MKSEIVSPNGLDEISLELRNSQSAVMAAKADFNQAKADAEEAAIDDSKINPEMLLERREASARALELCRIKLQRVEASDAEIQSGHRDFLLGQCQVISARLNQLADERFNQVMAGVKAVVLPVFEGHVINGHIETLSTFATGVEDRRSARAALLRGSSKGALNFIVDNIRQALPLLEPNPAT